MWLAPPRSFFYNTMMNKHKQKKNLIKERYAEPIEYILRKLRDCEEVELFDIMNAETQLKELKKSCKRKGEANEK